MLAGQVVYFAAYDVSYDVERSLVRAVLGTPLVPFSLDPTRRLPQSLLTDGVWVANLPPFAVQTPMGPATAACQLKLFAAGAISLTVRVPFQVEGLEALVPFHQVAINNRPLHDHLREVAESVFADLQGCLINPVRTLVPDEAYTLFFIDAQRSDIADAEGWFLTRRAAVAALLTEEDDATALAASEIEESTARRLSYYRDDLLAVDWDAALAVDVASRLEEVVHPMELANVQLAELEALDQILEQINARAYADVRGRRASASLTEIASARIDLARIAELLDNTGKLLGDWHLARIYRLTAERFHIPGWFAAVERKRQTLDDIHQSIKADRNHRLMVWLEVAIVVLFVIDLIPLAMDFLGMKH